MNNNQLIDDIINEFLNAKDVKEIANVIKALKEKNTAVQELSATIYKFNDYYINILPKVVADNLIKNLNFLKSLNINSVPDLYKAIECGISWSIVVTQVVGTMSDRPQQYIEVKKQVSNQAKIAFLKEIEKLLNSGYVDGNIFSNNAINNLYVTPDTNKILIGSVDNLQKIDKDDKKEIFNKYKKLLS